MIPNRVIWAPVGLLGVALLAFCIAVHVFYVSSRALFGSREAAEFMFVMIICLSVAGWSLFFFRGSYYRFLDTGLLVTVGIGVAYIASYQGTFMDDDFGVLLLIRASVYVGGLAMIRAWYVSGLPYHGPRMSVQVH